jgi:hypothetical protein
LFIYSPTMSFFQNNPRTQWCSCLILTRPPLFIAAWKMLTPAYLHSYPTDSSTILHDFNLQDTPWRWRRYALPKALSLVYIQNMNVVCHSDCFIFSVHSGMEAASYSETFILTAILKMETTNWHPPIIKCILFSAYKTNVLKEVSTSHFFMNSLFPRTVSIYHNVRGLLLSLTPTHHDSSSSRLTPSLTQFLANPKASRLLAVYF